MAQTFNGSGTATAFFGWSVAPSERDASARGSEAAGVPASCGPTDGGASPTVDEPDGAAGVSGRNVTVCTFFGMTAFAGFVESVQ